MLMQMTSLMNTCSIVVGQSVDTSHLSSVFTSAPAILLEFQEEHHLQRRRNPAVDLFRHQREVDGGIFTFYSNSSGALGRVSIEWG